MKVVPLSQFWPFLPVVFVTAIAISFGYVTGLTAWIRLSGAPEHPVLTAVDLVVGGFLLLAGVFFSKRREWARRALAIGAIPTAVYEIVKMGYLLDPLFFEVRPMFMVPPLMLVLVGVLAASSMAKRHIAEDLLAVNGED